MNVLHFPAGIIALALAVILTLALAARRRHPVKRCQLCSWQGRRQHAYQRHHNRCHAVRSGIRLPRTDPDIPAVPQDSTSLTWPLSNRAQQAAPLPRRYT